MPEVADRPQYAAAADSVSGKSSKGRSTPPSAGRKGVAVKVSIVLASTVLAALSAGQAASNVLAKSDPLQARAAFFAPAKADDAAARAISAGGRPDLAQPFAQAAYRINPLSGNALAVMGQTVQNPRRQAEFLNAAALTTKRRTLLQGVLLTHYSQAGDVDNSLQTIDYVARVYPRTGAAMTPQLIATLDAPDALPVFTRLLAGDPPWMNAFMIGAAAKPELLPKVKALRASLNGNVAIDTDVDSAIMAAFFQTGDYGGAFNIYQQLVRGENPKRSATMAAALDWTAQYPPFDWLLAEDPKEYARISPNGQRAEIFLKRGNGGVLASRIFRAANPISGIKLTHDLEYPSEESRLDVKLVCLETATLLIDAPITGSPATFPIGAGGQRCTTYAIELSGRARTVDGNIRGTIAKITLVPVR